MVSLCIVRLTYLLLGWIGSLCAVAFLLGLALVAIVAVVWCGLNPLFTFYESLLHLCGSMLPLFYRDPKRAVLACFFVNFYVLVLLGELVLAASKNMVRLSALYWTASL